jgi:hypothetical protein
MASSITPSTAIGGEASGGDAVTKVRENRLRRMAERQGLVLHKSRRRDPRAIDHGLYWLVDEAHRAAIVRSTRGATLDAIESYLTGS